MLNRYLILGIFAFFLAVFGLFIFWEGEEKDSGAGEKEIVWIEKPSFMLLKEIKSQNPVLRREAIIKLGEKRVKNAIEPLFEILFSDYPLYEKQLSAKSVAMISGEEILPLCVRILENYDEKASKDVVLSMLYILKNLDLTGKDLSRYDFSILSKLLNASSNEVILNAIESIENLKYMKAFHELTLIYSKNFFFKVAVLKALTRLALEEEKLSVWLSGFLSRTLINETHDSVRQTIRESLFALNFKRKPDTRESQVIGVISGLNSSSFRKVLESQLQLLQTSYDEKDLPLFSFFLTEKDPIVANRMIDFVRKHKIAELIPVLKNLIKNRYAGTNPQEKEVAQDSARKALSALSVITGDPQDAALVLSLTQDGVLGYEALQACLTLILRDVDREQIEKRLTGLFFYSLSSSQKAWLEPLMNITLKTRNDHKAFKLIEQGEPYVRYNALNAFLSQRVKLPEELKHLRNSPDPVIKSILGRYQS